jgi:hypothetical protein
MAERIRFLERNRAAISEYLVAVRQAQAEGAPQTPNPSEAAVSA